MNSDSNKIKDSAKIAEFVEKHEAKNPNPSASKTERSLAKPKPKARKNDRLPKPDVGNEIIDAAAESQKKKKNICRR